MILSLWTSYPLDTTLLVYQLVHCIELLPSTGRAGEVVEALSDRKVHVACIQETQCYGSGCKCYEAKGK